MWRYDVEENKKNNENLYEKELDEIKESGVILMYLNNKGNITLLTSGKITKIQSKTAEKMLAACSPSLVLSIVLFIEIAIVKLEDKVSMFFDKLFNRV